MPASLSAIRAGIKTRLETIPDLQGGRVYDFVPGSANLPAVVIVPGTFIPGDTKAAITFDGTMGRGSDDHVYTLALMLSRGEPDEVMSDKLDAYLAASGTNSIKAAVEADQTLGGVVSYAHVQRVVQYGALVFNQLSFFGAQIIVEVVA